jgi:hypothetical protein
MRSSRKYILAQFKNRPRSYLICKLFNIKKFSLDLKENGKIDLETLRIFLLHSFTVRLEIHYPFLEELFIMYPPSR